MQGKIKNPNLYKKVCNFHKKYKLKPQANNKELQEARIRHMTEELNEYRRAVKRGDRYEQLDALVDLVYVALGTAYYESFDFNRAFDIVHSANMKKVQRVTARSRWDVVKPAGWRAPDIKDCI